nr:unnamed protein product [Spirometra erinaceieuropaei]
MLSFPSRALTVTRKSPLSVEAMAKPILRTAVTRRSKTEEILDDMNSEDVIESCQRRGLCPKQKMRK